MSEFQDHAELEAWCEALVAGAGLSVAFNARNLCVELSRSRGRLIELRPSALPTTGSGWLIRASRHDLIAFHEDASDSRQSHVIFHEIVHLMRGHLEQGDVACRGVGDFFPETPEDGYADPQEWEAEAGATILSAMSRRRANPGVLSVDAPAADHQVASTFGIPGDGPP